MALRFIATNNGGFWEDDGLGSTPQQNLANPAATNPKSFVPANNPFIEGARNQGNEAAAQSFTNTTNLLGAAMRSGIYPTNWSKEAVDQVAIPLQGQNIGYNLTDAQKALVNNKIAGDNQYKSLYQNNEMLKDVEAESARTGAKMSDIIARNPQLQSQLDLWLSANPNYVSKVDPYGADQRSWLAQNKLKAALIAAGIATGGFGALKSIGGPITAAQAANPYASRFAQAAASSAAGSLKAAQLWPASGEMAPAAPPYEDPATGQIIEEQIRSELGTDAASGGSGGGFLGNLFSGIGNTMAKNPLLTALGAYSLYKGATTSTPNLSDMVSSHQNISTDPNYLALQNQISGKQGTGLSEEEKIAMRDDFQKQLKQQSEQQRELLKDNLISRGLMNSSIADKAFAKQDQAEKDALSSFEKSLMAKDAELKRQSTQYNTSTLIDLQQLINAQKQQQYDNSLKLALQELESASLQKSMYGNAAQQFFLKMFTEPAGV